MILSFGYVLLTLFVVFVLLLCLMQKKVFPDFGSLVLTGLAALGVTFLVQWVSADVTVIHHDKSHDSYMVFGSATFSVDGEDYTLEDLKKFKSYIVNETDDDLLLYAVCYGDKKIDMRKYKPCLIKVGMYSEVSSQPDFYFEEPDSINVSDHFVVSIFKSILGLNYEIKWVIDEYDGQ